jgi:2-keto-4-pentenoate hydratase/2-oxohepta-3-ene-1,7-dioic acid hydratase in catechol pathway
VKIVRFIHAGTQSYGVVTEGGVVDAGARLRPKFGDVTDVLTAGALGELEALTDASADFALADIRYLPPVKGANSVLAVGRNYGSAYADMGTNFPGHPSIFMRRHGSHAGHLEPLIRPKASQFFDGEAELAVIIGTGGRHIPEDTAMDHIAFYSILNDGTLTDWADHTSRNVSPGKNFDSCGAFGPWMVSRDEIADAHALTILHRINGEEIQNGSTGDMIFSIAQILAYVSTFTALEPGDVITTGSPGGIRPRREAGIYLKPGDQVEMEISGIGVLANPVQDED